MLLASTQLVQADMLDSDQVRNAASCICCYSTLAFMELPRHLSLLTSHHTEIQLCAVTDVTRLNI